MPAPNTIAPDKLARLVGTAAAPLLIDLRGQAAAGRLPGSLLRAEADVADWAGALGGGPVVIVDETGGAPAHGVAAWLRSEGGAAEVLDGGAAAWRAAGLPLVNPAALPPIDRDGRTVWVTRARPKVDRIACPWLIRRFVDPSARVLFVAPAVVGEVAGRTGGAPFDVDGVFWSHRGELCTFDVMLAEFGLASHRPLATLAAIVRGADTDRLELAPEAAGLLAVSLGLSRMYVDDLQQLEAGLVVYDALYRWCRDAQAETHTWASHAPARAKVSA